MRRAFIPLVLALLVAACADDSDPAGPGDETVETLTVDASATWAFVELGDDARVVTVQDRSSSSAWDLAFFATSVMLNGGSAGPGGVVGHCLCRNAGASDADVMDMTSEAELAAFEAVTEADIPEGTEAWTADELAAAIDGWYAYDPVNHVVSAAPENVWKVRTASGDAFAKLHVTGIEGGTQEHAGRVTFEYALQPAAGAAFAPTRTATVDVSAGAVRYDLEAGAVVEGGEAWDLLFDGWNVRVNGGVSGDGEAGAVAVEESFEAVTDASDVPAQVYRGDAFGGVFVEHAWYRYNLEGNHRIWPTFQVYLVQDGSTVYKLQLTGYYGSTGDTRQISLRYARLR